MPAHLVISAETRDNVSGLRDKQKVVHALHGLADAVAAAVTALGLARVVWSLFRTTFYLQTGAQQWCKFKGAFKNPRRRFERKLREKQVAETHLTNYRTMQSHVRSLSKINSLSFL